LMLFRTFGGAFSVSLMGTVLLHQMQRGLAKLSTSGLSSTLLDKLAHPQNLLEPATRMQITPELLPRLISILSNSIWYAFLTGFALMAMGVIASLMLPSARPGEVAQRPQKPG
jgi:hypothetical protein